MPHNLQENTDAEIEELRAQLSVSWLENEMSNIIIDNMSTEYLIHPTRVYIYYVLKHWR